MCTAWSSRLAPNESKLSTPEVERRGEEARLLLCCACAVDNLQLSAGRHLLREHPDGCTLMGGHAYRGRAQQPGGGSAAGHQCMRGQMAPAGDGSWFASP